MKTIKFILLTLILINLSCTNDSEDDLTEPVILNQNEPVTFNNVSSIFQNNCISCHSNPPVNGAPMSLINYNDIKDAVENRNLIDRISRQTSENGAMPLGGPRLPQNLIDLVILWQEDGLLEN